MGHLEFLFGKKKKTETSVSQSKPVAKSQTMVSSPVTNSNSSAKTSDLSITPFVFESNQHQRYENGNPVKGLQECPRVVKVEKNVNGCNGYQLKSGDGYIVRMINGDTGQPQMSAKPMRVIKSTATEVTLRGYMVSAQTPFGFQDVDMADYGLTVSLKDDKVVKCVLHMYDRNVDIEYQKISTKAQHVFETEQRKYQNSPNSHHLFKKMVEKAIIIANQNPIQIQELQNALFEVYSCINKPGCGKFVTEFHDKQKLAECFIFMLRYDWVNDSDLREVWAENGLYCIVDLIRNGKGDPIEQAQYFLELFMLLRWGKESLIPKVQDLLNKARILNNPIFDDDDYNNGAAYVINQFAFLTINALRPLAQQDIRIIAGFMEACDGNDYFQQCTKLDFYRISPNIIFEKMKFVASIICSILDDM